VVETNTWVACGGSTSVLQHSNANSFRDAALIFTEPILMMRVLTMATPSSLERGGKPQVERS
jgi:hypothetical protein